MKTITPKGAVEPEHDVSEESAASEPSSNAVANPNGNPMSDMGDKEVDGALSYEEVHCESTKPGKMDFAFMEKETTETPMEVPKHAEGAYPITDGQEEPNDKPTHAPNTYVPAEEADTKPEK
jgi:hypothetical protein